MKQAEILALKSRIKKDFDIDLEDYRNEEVVSNFVDLLIFPKYVFKWVVRPIAIAILLYIIGFFVLQFSHVDFLFYMVGGLVLFVLVGVFSGLLYLTFKIRDDIWGVIEYSFDILKKAIDDIGDVGRNMKNGNKKNILGLLFTGVIQVVTIPLLTKVIKNKVPVLGSSIAGVFNKVLSIVSSSVVFKNDDYTSNTPHNPEEPISSSKLHSISKVSDGVENVLENTFKVVQWPLKLAVIIFALVLVIFVYLVN